MTLCNYQRGAQGRGIGPGSTYSPSTASRYATARKATMIAIPANSMSPASSPVVKSVSRVSVSFMPRILPNISENCKCAR